MGNRCDDGEGFHRAEFLDLPQSALLWLLKSDYIAYSEDSLINGCVRWAKHKVQARQPAATNKESGQAVAINKEPGQAGTTNKKPGQAAATKEEPGPAVATNEEPVQANATNEDPGQAAATNEEPGQATATNEEPQLDLNALHAYLKPLIPYFRICSMSDSELDYVLREETLLPPDLVDILKEYKATQDKTKLPLAYSDWDMDERFWVAPEEIYIYAISPDDDFIKGNKIYGMIDLFHSRIGGFYLRKTDDEVRISFKSQIRPEGVRARCYLEDVTITLEEPFHDATVFTSRFTSLVQYNTIVSVPMKMPAQFNWRPLMAEMRCNLYLIHHVSGTYPLNLPWGHSYNLKKMEEDLDKGSKYESEMNLLKLMRKREYESVMQQYESDDS
jgi:hypothetical protein